MTYLTFLLTNVALVLVLTSFVQKSKIAPSEAVPHGTFNHSNFIIHFAGSPSPSNGLNINNVEDFLPMIEKISSEFSQIYCVNKIIPVAVATHNKLLSTKHAYEGVYQKPLEVYLRSPGKSEPENGTTFVDALVELADKSNDIFPGTVKYLLAHYSSFDKKYFNKYWRFSEARLRFMHKDNSTHHTYKLGIVFPLEDCEKAILKSNSTLSNDVHLVAFVSWIVYSQKDNLTVEESFVKLKTKFEFCAKAATSVNPEIELVFQTGISDTDPNGKQDYFALVTFWEMVNDWAISTNVKVTIFEAFDTPDSVALRSTRGLWKLARTPRRYQIPADFIFMDKRLGIFSNSSITEAPSLAENIHELIEDLDFKHEKFVVVFDSNQISEYDGKHYYHHDDFLPVIRTIANKFSSVMLNKFNSVVIEAVAMYNSIVIENRNRSNNSPGLIQPLRLYQFFKFSKDNNLDHTLNTTKKINFLFPDTVKFLVFHVTDADKLFSYVTRAGEAIINQTFELGITLPLLDCLEGSSARTQVFRVLSYMKLILVTMGTQQEDYDIGVGETVDGLTTAFSRCKKKIKSISGIQTLQYGFSLAWADTDSSSSQNLSMLVNFWGQMNYWAKFTDTTVIMTEAFDDVSITSSQGTYGWWRLAFKPHIYNTIVEYVYKDKTEMRNRISNGIPYEFDNASLNGDVAFRPNWKVTNSSFSRTNFIVQFDPLIREAHIKEGLNEDKTRNIILKLFTRFSSICTPGMYKEDQLTNMGHLPMEVAKFSQEHGQKNESQNLYLIFIVDKEYDAFGAFQLALRMTKMANSISAGTVEYFIVYNDDGYLDDGRDQVNYFIKAKNWLREASTKTISYKLGYIYSISECGQGTNLNKGIIPSINVLDLIIFDKHTEDMDYEVGVYESIRGFTRIFERCKEKISMLNLSIEVAFRTSWSDTDKYHGYNSNNLVLFWEKMNEWAVSTNTKIFMVEAFDSPNSETPALSKLGWWRLLSEEIHNGNTKYIFEEKREVVFENLTKKKSVEEPSHQRTVLVSVLTALVAFALSAFSVFIFVYRRYKNKLVQAQQYILTKKEEIEFLEGDSQLADVKLREKFVAGTHLPKYDKDYEVERKYFKFDETILLGSGEFGIVYKGTITKGESEIDVAVKTLKKLNSSKAVRDLLVEIKVMIYLGKHESIVSVIGAHTEEMRRGNVFLFTELCEKGSLENYLRELRRQSVALVRDKDETKMNEQINKVGDDELDLYHSIEPLSNANSYNQKESCTNGLQRISFNQNLCSKWSYEIANGMEFITSKKVVHADLATRNVLLTENLTAKISDFGLSRRLYNYTNYVKTQQQAIPWKWMSPESLRRSEFNEKTDVWAFGITLWEIYSLGDTPYPGLSWSVNFPLTLERGLRPQEPEFNANSIYSVMLRCWNIDPKNRPTFLQLKEILERL